jgi:hypothetical protein
MSELATATPETPTETSPELGTIGIQVGDRRIPISMIEHWIEDDRHVFRSTEFDCMGEGDTELGAVVAFVENAEDLFRFLDDVLDSGRATEAEKMTLIKLSRRFFEIYEATTELEQKKQHISRWRKFRRRPPMNRPQWQRQPALGNSSELSHA